MARDNYEAGLLGETAGHDTLSYEYQRGVLERERRAKGGGSWSTESGVASSSGSIVLAAVAVIIAFCAFIVSFCVYPIAGLSTLFAFGIGTGVINGDGHNTMNGVGLVFALMVPCYLIFRVTFGLEMKMGKVRSYQIFRHYWRLVVGTYAVHVLGTSFHLQSQYPEGAPLSGYLMDWGMTFAAFFLLYLNSKRLDSKYELEPVENKKIDVILAPVLNWVTSPAPKAVRETGLLHAKALDGQAIEIAVQADQSVRLGGDVVPVSHIRDVEEVRTFRMLMRVAGIVLFFAAPVVVKGMFGGFESSIAQILGVAGIVFSAYLVLTSFLNRTPPGKLQGPFRSHSILFDDVEKNSKIVELKFASAKDERLFMQALKNHQKDAKDAASALSGPSPADEAVSFQQAASA
ncbi:MAG: hypothetical protein H6858_10235 [Rhodospirillales bacterium]|nr:hypothetical protein [Alphaproteobacteria bacterium]MCB1841122.1 hypothetical protein [Alphaproteobacteria bacterium]MCB9977964.1 hypothetical protein [Rhodospirillales bacterium]